MFVLDVSTYVVVLMAFVVVRVVAEWTFAIFQVMRFFNVHEKIILRGELSFAHPVQTNKLQVF